MLGLAGYTVGALAVGLLSAFADGGLAERAIAIAAPPFGFWFAVSLARAVLGFEQIVFYQAAFAAWLTAVAAAALAHRDAMVVSDLVVVLIAVFNTFGRVGCYHVACCHGRPARFGVRYGHAHAQLGFPSRWVGRPLLPIQLVEAVASACLAIACAVLILSREPSGMATMVFVDGYALVRFSFELVRGDSGRPYYRGLSEAQWIAVASATLIAAVDRAPAAVACAGVLWLAAAVTARRSSRGVLRRPRHLDELDRAHSGSAGMVSVTSQGLEVSTHPLDDRRVDIVWRHAELSLGAARTLAADLFAKPDLVAGSKAGIYHVIVETAELAPTSR